MKNKKYFLLDPSHPAEESVFKAKSRSFDFAPKCGAPLRMTLFHVLFFLGLMMQALPLKAQTPAQGQEISPGVKVIEHDAKLFRSDPDY